MNLFITVAPVDYSGNIDADFICTGENDELTIQKAVDKCIEENKNVMLLNGIYYVDDFHDYCAKRCA